MVDVPNSVNTAVDDCMYYEIEVQEHKAHIDDPFAFFVATISLFGKEKAFFLESLSGPKADTKDSIIGLTSAVEVQVSNTIVQVYGTASSLVEVIINNLISNECVRHDSQGSMILASSDAFWQLPDIINQSLQDRCMDDFRGHGLGLLTYYGYDAVYYIEQLPKIIPSSDSEFPDAVFRIITACIDIDKNTGDGIVRWITGKDLPSIDITEWLKYTHESEIGDQLPKVPYPDEINYEQTESGFIDSVVKCKEHISGGDIYQVQIGHRISVKTSAQPLDIYRRLRTRNPSPYMSMIPIAGRYIIGASPELFVRTDGKKIIMRPLAGTARRENDPIINDQIKHKLINDEKERAEHIMLVDLCRNDFGRIAIFGSIDVTEFIVIEQYSHLFHLVSNVEARLQDNVRIGDAIKATFPAGTVTGAPKIRAMEIIESHELSRRGFYGGAFGIIRSNSSCVIGLALRTIMFDGCYYHLRASAGIVADSDPSSEWQETLTKLGAPYWAVVGTEIREGK